MVSFFRAVFRDHESLTEPFFTAWYEEMAINTALVKQYECPSCVHNTNRRCVYCKFLHVKTNNNQGATP